MTHVLNWICCRARSLLTPTKLSTKLSTGCVRNDLARNGSISNTKFGGPEGIRTPDLLNAVPGDDGPAESTRVVFEFKPDSDYKRFVRQSPPKSSP